MNPLVKACLEAAEESAKLLVTRVSNIRMGPIDDTRGWVLFDFEVLPGETRTMRMPEPYPEVLWGSEDTVAARRLCVKALLNNTAEVVH